jgi:hypothetical protein
MAQEQLYESIIFPKSVAINIIDKDKQTYKDAVAGEYTFACDE